MVAGDQLGLVCQRDGGDQQIAASDATKSLELPQPVELGGCSDINGKDGEILQVLFVCCKSLLGQQELFAIFRRDDGGESPLENLDPCDYREGSLLGSLGSPVGHPFVALKQES